MFWALLMAASAPTSPSLVEAARNGVDVCLTDESAVAFQVRKTPETIVNDAIRACKSDIDRYRYMISIQKNQSGNIKYPPGYAEYFVSYHLDIVRMSITKSIITMRTKWLDDNPGKLPPWL